MGKTMMIIEESDSPLKIWIVTMRFPVEIPYRTSPIPLEQQVIEPTVLILEFGVTNPNTILYNLQGSELLFYSILEKDPPNVSGGIGVVATS